MNIQLADLNINAALPVIILLVGVGVILLADLFLNRERKHYVPLLSMAVVGISFVVTLLQFNEVGSSFFGMYIADGFTSFVYLITLVTAFISILMSIDYIKRVNIHYGEFYVLLILSTAGVMLMASANDIIMIFIALELLSIPLYILAAFRALDRRSNSDAPRKSEEGGVKYFILGAFASAFFVYGAALVYGATGTTNIPDIFAAVGAMSALQSTPMVLLVIGATLMIVGLGFKVAVVPFHMWTPDVYEGAPTPITGFMSVAAKVGGFAALLRLLILGLSTLILPEAEAALWQNLLAVIAAITIIFGNVVAISQQNVKRLLAYSSIAHAGYIMMAVAAAGSPGMENQSIQAALLYLLAYMFTNLGAFAVVMAVERDDGTGTDMENFAGLWNTRPILAIAMAVFMFSLTGIPLTAGFIGKFVVFDVTLQAGLVWLVVVGALFSVVSAFYYVRVIIKMFLDTDAEGESAAGATLYTRWAIYATVAGTFIIGILVPLTNQLVSLAQITS